ncbi:uncharacterized protein M421DRAFT_63465 [Didymella exigua CBS 183.55]|uniref:DUF6536 domain-containing protein n=1 Tax=Didymella exigua CBS 183.55 TaxID=1150837 RepID=A0A6A5RM26_9PLEO|nr:uncharacterized protein M421DRAFT_63465 [Didymella exigua CBS 183.55]KAF1928320.1 hypothetical protein M421DRAFT_63465 [Didymella exigua CBS 183.55]
MANRVLSPARDSVSAFRRTRVAYLQTHGADSVELAQLNTASTDSPSTTDPRHSPTPSPTQSAPHARGKSGWIRRYRSSFTGWRFGALHFATWAAIVFLVNLIGTIWGAVYQRSAGSLSEGDCGRIKNLDRGLHIFINVLSTILLSGSNYCMQCLSAPTRTDVDRAHASQTWLDIGIPSIRNLKHISRPRLWLWLGLGLSSVPLHLLYNSAVYSSTSTNSYAFFLVNEAFLDASECHNCTWYYSASSYYNSHETRLVTLETLWSQSRNGSLDRLEPAQCLTDYAKTLQSNRRNLLLVMDNAQASASPRNSNLSYTNNPDTFLYGNFFATDGALPVFAPDSYSWICSGLDNDTNTPCANRLGQISPDTWTVGGYDYGRKYAWPVKYCLSEPAVSRCRLQFTPTIAAIVTVLNLFKALLMWFVIYSTKEDPLLTMGDAVASFLDERDPTTVRSSLISLHDCKADYDAGAKPWRDQRTRWKDTTSRLRRGVTLGLFATALLVIINLLVWGTKAIARNASIGPNAIFALGFGTIDTRALIYGDFPTDMISLVLIANLPQVILSFLYFAYNGTFTAMLLGYEWTSYAYKRKGLRVSHVPSGLQRSTYFLQLPYRFGIPLVVLSGTLHWLVSQSIFVVALDQYDRTGVYNDSRISCGYSPVAMLVVVVLGIFMVATVVGFGYIPYRSGMPLAGSCSLAISAACHPDEDTKGESTTTSEEKLQWGVASTSTDGIGHCAFSSREVGPLVEGRMYA